MRKTYKLLIFFLFLFLQPGETAVNDGEVRRIGSQNIIEIFYQSEWRPICQEGIQENEAKAICRQLNPEFEDSYSITTNLSCDQSTIMKSSSITTIKSNYGIDLNGFPENSYKLRVCQLDESFKECLERQQPMFWKQSDCSVDQCFSLKCSSKDINDSQTHDELNYGKPLEKPQLGQIIQNKAEQIFVYTGNFWDPVCSTSFDLVLANKVCKSLEKGSPQTIESVKCDLNPTKQGYRDTNFQRIGIISDNSHKYIYSLNENCESGSKNRPCVVLKCYENSQSLSSIIVIVILIIIVMLLIGTCLVIQKRKLEKQKKYKEQEKQLGHIKKTQTILQSNKIGSGNNLSQNNLSQRGSTQGPTLDINLSRLQKQSTTPMSPQIIRNGTHRTSVLIGQCPSPVIQPGTGRNGKRQNSIINIQPGTINSPIRKQSLMYQPSQLQSPTPTMSRYSQQQIPSQQQFTYPQQAINQQLTQQQQLLQQQIQQAQLQLDSLKQITKASYNNLNSSNGKSSQGQATTIATSQFQQSQGMEKS